MAKTSTVRNDEVLYIRLPLATQKQVEKYRVQLEKAAPIGVKVTTAAAIRNLVESALRGSVEVAA